MDLVIGVARTCRNQDTAPGLPNVDNNVTVGVEEDRRRAWFAAACEVTESGIVTMLCPENRDEPLSAEWIPAAPVDRNGRGEYRLWFRGCGAENYLLLAGRKP